VEVPEAGIRQLMKAARQQGYRGVAPVAIRIEVEMEDLRTHSVEPLPAAAPREFTVYTLTGREP
jgi:hypothetical protein